jgi:hypothetical protein
MSDFSIVLSTGMQLPERMDYDDEYHAIREETNLGTMLRESALFRIWRIKSFSMYEITDDGEEQYAPRFRTWPDFVKTVAENAGVSRSTVYSRIRVYDQLAWLGYDLLEAYAIVVHKSYLSGKVLDTIIDWARNFDESTFKTDYFGVDVDPVDYKEEIKDLLEECLAHDSVSGALKNLDSEVLGKPIVDMYYMNGAMVVAYEGEDGVDVVRFETSNNREVVPDWVLEILADKYKVRRAE